MIGSLKDIENLKTADKARVLVISDSHGERNVVEFILKQENKDIDALIFCGDGISDLTYILNSKPELLPKVVCFVRGNNDSSGYNTAINGEYTNIFVPESELIKIAGHNIYVTHGHKANLFLNYKTLTEMARTCNAEIALFGHIHVALHQKEDGILILNPGSCSRPRGGQPPCYAVLELAKGKSEIKREFFEIRSNSVVSYIPSFTNFLW